MTLSEGSALLYYLVGIAYFVVGIVKMNNRKANERK